MHRFKYPCNNCLSVRFNNDDYSVLRAYCFERGITINSFIRFLVQNYFYDLKEVI